MVMPAKSGSKEKKMRKTVFETSLPIVYYDYYLKGLLLL